MRSRFEAFMLPQGARSHWEKIPAYVIRCESSRPALNGASMHRDRLPIYSDLRIHSTAVFREK